MKFKRFICLALALVLAVGALALPAAAEERAPRSYYREEQLAYALKALGLFRGVSDRDLDLDGAPERAQALVMMLRLMGLETEAAAEEGEQPFTDLDACRWASAYAALSVTRRDCLPGYATPAEVEDFARARGVTI